MPTSSAVERLLVTVRRRETSARFGHRAAMVFVVAAGAALSALAVVRLAGLDGERVVVAAALATPVVALIAALVATRRPSAVAVARQIDAHSGSDDLFLTVVTIAHSAGSYQDVVRARAEAIAASVDPVTLRPLRARRPAAMAFGAAAALAAAVLWLPRLDPFGQRAAREQIAAQQRAIEQVEQRTRTQVQQLACAAPDAELSAAVAADLERLITALENARPNAPGANAGTLADTQAALGREFAEARQRDFANGSDALGGQQSVGDGHAQDLRRALAAGDATRAVERVDALRTLADRLAQTTDAAERERLRQELKQGLQQLADALGSGAAGAGASQALQQALQQLAQSADPALARRAAEALATSLDLARVELSALAQGTRDAGELRRALETLQLAKQLDQQGRLGPGEGGGKTAAQRLQSYRERYRRLLVQGQLAGKGRGDGKGMGGKGHGRGGTAPTNDAAQTDTTPEQARVEVGQGATVAQWKTAGDADPGVAQERYRQGLSDARQEVSEALTHERLPPGDEAAVRRYFELDGASAEPQR